MKLKEKMRKGKDGGRGLESVVECRSEVPKRGTEPKEMKRGKTDRHTKTKISGRAEATEKRERERERGRGRRAEDTLSERVSKNATRSVQARGSQPKGETDETGEWG